MAMTTRAFTPAWLSGDPVATRFLSRGFAEASARADAVRRACAHPIEAPVLSAFAAQEARRPWSRARADNLERLARGAAVVVTGQQVGLFLGPLYTLHKAASAVVDAAALSRETGHPVVPVFWLQTEDHDFEEVRATVVPGPLGPMTIALGDASGADARVSLSERKLGEQVAVALDQLEVHGAHAAEVAALLGRHYRADAGWGEAFGNVIAELFADHGLLVFDPRAAVAKLDIARLAAPVHALSLGRADAIAAALGARAQALHEAGFTVQVPVREGAALSCYADGVEGARHRLERDGQRWATPCAALDHAALEAALAHTPERFTTTALLRPLLQDTLLPTAAYVGGPGELAYFAELHPLYELAGKVMPLAVPRARFTLTTATTRRLGEELGLTPADAATPRAELLARVARNQAEIERLGELERATLAGLADNLAALAVEAERMGDTGFGKHEKKAGEIARHAVERLFERSRKLLVERDAVAAERLARFQMWLAPRGEPQERVLGFVSFAAQVGVKALVDRIVDSVAPFDGTPRVVDL